MSFSLMAEPEPVALMALDTNVASAMTTLAAGVAAYANTLRPAGERSASTGTGVTKVYNIAVNAAPDVPTEESLRKQLDYADTLYR